MPRGRLLQKTPSPALVLGAIASVQFASAIAAHGLFHRVGPGGAALLRLGAAAILMLALSRPRVRGRSRKQWLPVVGLGLAIGAMNVCFYHAIARIPLGIAVTIEFIGPLAVGLAGSRRRRDLLWVVLAVAGIVALAHGSAHHLNLLGVMFAVIAGAMWACYILFQSRLGQVFTDGSGLALATGVAALVALPDGLIEGGSSLFVPGTLAIGVLVGFMGTLIPSTFELEALRRIRTGTFGILMSLEPALAAIAGLLVLSQHLSARELLGILLVIIASLGTALNSPTPVLDP
jgi:inner membrane transporter RhtA